MPHRKPANKCRPEIFSSVSQKQGFSEMSIFWAPIFFFTFDEPSTNVRTVGIDRQLTDLHFVAVLQHKFKNNAWEFLSKPALKVLHIALIDTPWPLLSGWCRREATEWLNILMQARAHIFRVSY